MTKPLRHLITLMTTVLALSASFAARASVVYYYTGQHFTTGDTSSAVTGQFSVASPFGDNLTEASFAPVSFDFTDGTFTMDSSTTVFSSWKVSTDAMGDLTHWSITLEGGPAGSGSYTYEIAVTNDAGVTGVGDLGDGNTTLSGGLFYDNENNVAGSFSTTPPGPESVPEPSSPLLVLTALGALSLARARREQRAGLQIPISAIASSLAWVL